MTWYEIQHIDYLIDYTNEVIEMCAKQIDEQSETHYTCNQTYHDLRRVSKDIRNLKVKG